MVNPRGTEANEGRTNPNFNMRGGYAINYQSSVVGYEARLRGYSVQTLPNEKGSMLEKLSRATNMAWIEPKTGLYPEYIFDDTIKTVEQYAEFLENTVEPRKRYTFQFAWKGRAMSGHIIALDRSKDEVLRFYDPQIGITYVGQEVIHYLKRIKFEETMGGIKIPIPPKILRIDDKQFNIDVVNYILEGVKE